MHTSLLVPDSRLIVKEHHRKVSGVAVYVVPGTVWLDGSVDYLSRTLTTSTTFTFSCWVKRLGLGAVMGILEGGVQFNADDTITAFGLTTTAKFRDPVSWYHIHVSDNGLFINGVSFGSVTTSALTNPDIGRTGTSELNGMLSEVVLLDGTSVAATSFGGLDSEGVWRPINPTGLTFGANGFWLDFANSADLGNDVSGNNNDWTLNSITSVNASADVLSDPLPVLNALWSNATLSEGNTKFVGASAHQTVFSTVAIPEGDKIYLELEAVTVTNAPGFGVARDSASLAGTSYPNKWFYRSNGDKFIDGSASAYGIAWSTGDVIGVAVDRIANDIEFFVNNSSQGSFAIPSTGTLVFYGWTYDATLVMRFGESDWSYAPPSGFTHLKLSNLSEPAIKDGSRHFAPILYTGNGTAIGSGGNAIPGLNFTPDLVWIKNRDAADAHMLFDVVRGTTNHLSSDSTAVEGTTAETLDSFDGGGFTVGSDVRVNTNAEKYVGWCWRAGGAPVNNSDGSITGSVSTNVAAGFSIVGFTGTGVNATVGHGLGATPGLVIVKERANDVGSWYVYHKANTAAPETDYLLLDTTAAKVDLNTVWNDTAPTSSVFSLGTLDDVNGSSDTYVALCWAEIEGFSKFGSFEGNGSADGSFVYLGFRPALVIIKSIDSTSSWHLYDNLREGYNVDNDRLVAEATTVEGTADEIDLLSNGFKLRIATDPNVSETYVYAAFAEFPFGGTGTTPAPAR